jgi:hypothetical protein
MSDFQQLDLVKLVDDTIRDCVAAHIPPVPRHIADAFASVLCHGFSEKDYNDYRQQIEKIAHDCWTASILREQRLDANLFHGGN